MRAWIAKFRISAAEDSGRPLPASVRKAIAGSEEVRRFAGKCRALDRALTVARPGPVVPPALHGAIMRSVRASHRSTPAHPALSAWLRLSAATAAAVLLVLATWAGWHRLKSTSIARQPMTQALGAPAMTFALGDSLAWPEQMSAVAPLTDELDRLDRDLNQTAQFILACLP
jgi:hypothetical protein